MPASEFVKAVDAVQAAVRPLLKQRGYRIRGRTFNRVTDDGLTHVINFQLGPSDPPGLHVPGLRDNLRGLFTVNLGVYVPEVAALQTSTAKAWVQEYHCCVRDRLASAAQDVWWYANGSSAVTNDVAACLLAFGLPFLERFGSRDLILAELRGAMASLRYCTVPRIVSAIILAGRKQPEKARELLVHQALETRNPGHSEYVRDLARRLGLGALSDPSEN